MRRGQRVRKPVTGIGPHAWIYYLLAVLLAPIAYFLLPDIQQDILNMLVGLSAVVATLLGARSQPTDHRLPFYLFAGGLLMTTVADFIYAVYEDVLLVEPFPSAADVFYVVNYPFYAVALLLLVWRRIPGRDWGGITDASILTTGAGSSRGPS